MNNKKKDHPRYPLPDELLCPLGALTVEFESLEMEVRFFIWRLANPREQIIGRAITAGMSSSALVNLLSALFHVRTKKTDLLKRLNRIIIQLESVREERNQIIHSYWVNRSESESALTIRHTISKKHGLIEHGKNITPDMVEELIKKVVQTRSELIDLHYAIVNSSMALNPDS